PSIKVAEAAKVIENSQRDINIAFVNELAKIFNLLNIDTQAVLEAAGTKWNFLPFKPGLVGGHCIGVDPYYLTYKAKELGYHAQIINAGRFVNDSMGGYVAEQTVKMIIANGKHISESKVLVMGATFKEDVSDIRNSKVVDVINELISFGTTVEVVDPHADSDALKEEYGFGLTTEMANDYDAVIVAVNHKDYSSFDEAYFKSITSENPVIVDIKGIYSGKINTLTYWSL
ncbi:MAG: nucleotide sugar dehydrogenase, partial [Flavobacteriales bacterium]|nr:nucleotide sugar dehydrogenase [Flavobacteriales bacterium]